MDGDRQTWPHGCLTPLIVMAALCPMSGCAANKWIHWNKEDVVSATAKNPADRIICVWEPAEGQGLDGVPSRGFAGQIFFFARSGASPVKVDGDARIYVFDDVGTPEEQAKPIHQFDFEGDAWTQHMRLSTLGAAYNVFVPYTRKNSYQANCALRVKFTPKGGSPIFSDMVTVTLPGPVNPAKEKTKESAAVPGLTKPPVEPPKLGASLTHQSGTLKDTTIALPESVAALTRGPQPSIPRASASRVSQAAPQTLRGTSAMPNESAQSTPTTESIPIQVGNQNAGLSSEGRRSHFTGRRASWTQPGSSHSAVAPNRTGFVGVN